jgi:hypothetical protein
MRHFSAAVPREPKSADWLLERTGFEPSRPFGSAIVDRGLLNPSGNELAALFGETRNLVTAACPLDGAAGVGAKHNAVVLFAER